MSFVPIPVTYYLNKIEDLAEVIQEHKNMNVALQNEVDSKDDKISALQLQNERLTQHNKELQRFATERAKAEDKIKDAKIRRYKKQRRNAMDASESLVKEMRKMHVRNGRLEMKVEELEEEAAGLHAELQQLKKKGHDAENEVCAFWLSASDFIICEADMVVD
jgi:chromosome segregation ATPase